MKKILPFLVVPLMAGCLTSSAPEVAHWMLDFKPERAAVSAPKYGITRLMQVAVRPPYNGSELVVLRANGSVAMDAYNVYAAQPAPLLRGCVTDALVASGLFKDVVGANSIVENALSVEVVFTRLALDCRDSEKRLAVADLVLRLIDEHGDLLRTIPASGSVEADGPDFSAALSSAASKAIENALVELR